MLLKVNYIFPLVLLVSFLVTSIASAQEIGGNLNRVEYDSYKIPLKSDQFIEPSYKNFEYILWRFGGYEINNDSHITRFIALNDCKLFKRYQNYDLEWVKIQNRFREFLKFTKSQFPGRISVKIPIGLKRFDEANSIFPVSEATSFDAIRILPVKRYTSLGAKVCKVHKSFIQDYDKHVLNDVAVSLKYPLTFKEIPVKKEDAQKYIGYVQRYNKYNSKMEGRIAYAFYNIKIFDYIRRTQDNGHLLYGEVMEVEVYADEEKSFPLYRFDPKAGVKTVDRGSVISNSDAIVHGRYEEEEEDTGPIEGPLR